MADNNKPLGALSADQYRAVETNLRVTRAVADVIMCGGAANCAPDTVHALGELIYYRLGEVESILGLDMEWGPQS